jgi:hypothetical protein
MNTQEAVRVVQGALNERKALAKIEEVLANVADAERREAELKERIAAQKVEIEGLDNVLAGLAQDIESARARALLDADSAREAFDREALVWAGKIAEIEAYYQGIVDEAAKAEAAHTKRVEEMNSVINALYNKAVEEEARLDAARNALVEIKAKL